MKLGKGYDFSALAAWFIVVNLNVGPSQAFEFANVFENVLDGLDTVHTHVRDVYCSYSECCNNNYIESNVEELRRSLDTVLFGQHIAKETIVNAIGGHLKNIHSSEKPLVISLHGPPGTGKNFVTEHVTRAVYKKGTESKYVHKYLGRIDFPLESEVASYKLRLLRDITAAVRACPKSLFIFDEVEKMPAGLFDSLVTLLDNHAYTKDLDFRQSIFIFLSNVAGPEIADKLKMLLDNGKMREATKLHDFEPALEIAVYNLAGGLYRSELIESHVVDHFVPFLPLELRHVENCIRAEYRKFTTDEIDAEFLEAVTTEAITLDESGIFSNNGCKRINKKVEALYYNRRRALKKQEL